MKRKLSILILNRNNSDAVLKIWNDLHKQTFQNFNLVVVDDNSENENLNKLLSIKNKDLYVFSYPSPWKFDIDTKFFWGLRKCAALSTDYTYCLQTDMKINSLNLLEKLVDFLDKNENYGAISPTIYDNNNNNISWGPNIIKKRLGRKLNINETVCFRNILINKMYDENKIKRLVYYGSEFYYTNWFRINKYLTCSIGGISVSHYGGGTSKKYLKYKHYYRIRTTIIILKLFNYDQSLLTKIRYLYEEISLQRFLLRKYLKKLKFLKIIMISNLMIKGLISGLYNSLQVKSIKANNK